jgi:hypothetical protein
LSLYPTAFSAPLQPGPAHGSAATILMTAL